MHTDPCFEDTSETTILKNVGESSKLTRKGENALKNEPIAVEDNSSLANCETLLHNTLFRNQPSSIHILAILMMIGMQWAIPYRSLTQTLSYKDVLPLKIFDLDDKTEKGGDFYSRYRWLKYFSSAELGAMLLLICYLLDLINLNIGCRRQDPLTTQVECKLKLIAEESKCDWFNDLHMLNTLWNISIKRLQGSQDIRYQNPESVRQGKIRNGIGLQPPRISYRGHSKTYRSEQEDFLWFRKDERMRTIPEEITKVETKETAFGNETHICQGTIDYSQKRKNVPAEIVGSVFSNEPGNTFSKIRIDFTFSFTENIYYQVLIPVQSSSIQKKSAILNKILNLSLSSKFKRPDLDFQVFFRNRIADCKPWILDAKILFNEYERLKDSFPVESEALLFEFSINELVGWRNLDHLISQLECKLKHFEEILKGACSYDLHVDERMLKIVKSIRIKRLYGTQDISFQNLESVRQGKMRKSNELPPSRRRYTGAQRLQN